MVGCRPDGDASAGFPPCHFFTNWVGGGVTSLELALSLLLSSLLIFKRALEGLPVGISCSFLNKALKLLAVVSGDLCHLLPTPVS